MSVQASVTCVKSTESYHVFALSAVVSALPSMLAALRSYKTSDWKCVDMPLHTNVNKIDVF